MEGVELSCRRSFSLMEDGRYFISCQVEFPCMLRVEGDAIWVAVGIGVIVFDAMSIISKDLEFQYTGSSVYPSLGIGCGKRG